MSCKKKLDIIKKTIKNWQRCLKILKKKNRMPKRGSKNNCSNGVGKQRFQQQKEPNFQMITMTSNGKFTGMSKQ